jgi:hypothetical protein
VLRQDSGALVQKLVAQRKEGKREAMLKDAPPPPEGERVEQPMRSNAMKRDFTGQLSEAKLLRAVESERQLQEVMANCSRPPRTAGDAHLPGQLAQRPQPRSSVHAT